MSNTKKVYRFKARLEPLQKMGYTHIISFPYSVQSEFGTNGNVRILGKINGNDINRALIPKGDGTHYIIVSGEMRRKIGLSKGEQCSVELWKNDEPNQVIIPEELAECFELEPQAKTVFERQTAGMQRGICYWIDSAKRPETRAKRAADMLNRLLSPEFTVGGVKGR